MVGYANEDIEYRKLQHDLSDSDSDESGNEKPPKVIEKPSEVNHATKIYIDVRKNLNNFL